MSLPSSDHSFIDSIAESIKSDLAPMARSIDQNGVYPESYLHKLGGLGGFAAGIPIEHGGRGLGLDTQIDVITHVGFACGATAFLAWCQSSCAWYLLHSPNRAVRERYLKQVARGDLLAGTGMSNAVKHLAGIEKIHLQAQIDGDHYRVNGTLPWVSNVGPGHMAITAAAVEGRGYVMFAVTDETPGLEQHACPAFSGMEGTQTLNLRFRDVRIPATDVLAHPEQFGDYIRRIKPGFVLGQAGMGFGVVQGCLKTIRDCNVGHAHVNQFLDHQGDELADELARLRQQAAGLATREHTGQAPILDVLELRARASELALKAANAAVLHAGAKGYLTRHPAQRHLREAVFVAIVTPALKHLRKEIHDIRQACLPDAPAADEPSRYRARAA